jgi:hypothetical protein
MKKRDKKKILGIAGIIAAAAAGTYLAISLTKKSKVEKPPKNAPQLDIENPGDQSEFVTAVSPSEMG